MKKSQPPNQFEMETLEPRVLLSGESAAAMAYASLPDELNPCGEVGAIPNLEEVPAPSEVGAPNPVYQQSLQYELSPNQTDIFAGIDAVELDYEQQPLSMEVEADSLAATSGDIKAAEDAAPSERLITETEQSAIAIGLEGLSNLTGVLEDFDAFGTPIPLTNGATMGQLLRPKEILDTRLFKAVYDYFSDATDPPTLEGLVAILEGGADQTGAVGRINWLNVGYYNSIDEIGVNVDLEAALNGEVRLNADGLAEQVRFQFSEGETAAYTASIKFDFTFGIEQKDGSAVFFAEVRKLTADLSIDKVFLQDEAGADAGQATLRVVSGKIDLNLKLDVNFDDFIAGNKRITLTDLQGIAPETIGDLLHLTTSGVFVADLHLAPSQRFDNSAGVVAFLNVKSEDIFSGTAPEVSLSFNISSLRNSILDLLKGIDGIGERLVDSSSQAVAEPFLGNSLNKIFSADHDSASSPFTKLYDPALDYFTLLDVFNFSIDENASAIGELPGIDTANFDINIGSHRLALKNLLENSFNLSLKADWDVSLYLPEIWSLLNPGFQINDYLPTFQALLGLPYLPRFDEIRSETKSRFGTFPSLNGLLEYLRMAGKRGTVSRSAEQPSAEPLILNGEYSPEQDDLRFDFFFDAVAQSDVAVDIEALFSDQFRDAGVSLSSDVIVTVAAEARLDLFASVSSDAVSLTKREASVTIRVNQEINGLGLTVEGLADSGMTVSEGRFAFDARTEIVAHGHDPPVLSLGSLSDFRLDALADNGFDTRTSGTFSLTLPVSSENSSHPILIIYVTSEDVSDPSGSGVTLQITQDQCLNNEIFFTAGESKKLVVSGSAVTAEVENNLTDAELNTLLNEAIKRWSALPLSSEQLGRLNNITAHISNLPDGTLGEARDYSVYVDSNAAGYGWFVDGTPTDNNEFERTDANHLTAAVGSAAADRIDLLTVLLHEIGHVIGFDHDAQLAVMDEALFASQRVLLTAGEFPVDNHVSAFPVTAASHTSTTLDLSDTSNNGQTIILTVLADGKVKVSGSASGDDNTTTGWTGITSIIGNNSAYITLLAPDLSNTWNLSGINAGTLTPNGLTAVTFSGVQNLTGGSAKDTFIFNNLGFVTGNLDDGIGTLEVQLASFVTLAGDFSFTKKTEIVNLNDGVTTNLSVDSFEIGVTGGLVFFGTHNGPYILDDNGTANVFTDDTFDADAVGFQAVVSNFALAILSNSGTGDTWYSAKGTLSSAELKNVPDLTASVSNVNLSLNTESNGKVIDFLNTPVIISGVTINFAGADGVQLNASGTFAAEVNQFVTLSGTVGFSKSGSNLIAAGSNLTAKLSAGTAYVQLAGANFGLRSSGALTAFELSGGTLSAALDGFASLDAATIKIQYTTDGTTITATTDDISVGSANYHFAANIAASTVSFELTGLNASVTNFVTITGGSIAFQKSGSDLVAVGSGLAAS
ncbi:MAG: LEPR-XLL domain-containing protein, partial [Syntrophales bacterium]|nr:LEPR-XLL domain-containing protein [Syntrophales bacterium]